jgi:hypothetical protein
LQSPDRSGSRIIKIAFLRLVYPGRDFPGVRKPHFGNPLLSRHSPPTRNL